jgi:hypothetical protein
MNKFENEFKIDWNENANTLVNNSNEDINEIFILFYQSRHNLQKIFNFII